MKEIDYKKKYEDALERARSMTKQNPPAFDKNLISLVFPELKESEDEKIRKQRSQCKDESNDVVKCLINGMRFFYDDNQEATWGTDKFSMKVKEIIAWLEKQDEKLDAHKVIEWLDEHIPTKFEDMQNYVNQFKEDFGL